MSLKGEGKAPLLQQYVDLRERYPDYLLLFQVGDFYECFSEDAERLARAMGLILTHKSSKDFVTPMAGVPLRSADQYVERLLAKGFRVAIADQLEHPSEAEGLVKRDITQLITPGTVACETLHKVHDLERLASRLAAQQASARDLAALGRSLALIPHLKAQLSGRREQALALLAERLKPLSEVQTRIAAALVDTPPQKLGEGGLIRDGFDTARYRPSRTANATAAPTCATRSAKSSAPKRPPDAASTRSSASCAKTSPHTPNRCASWAPSWPNSTSTLRWPTLPSSRATAARRSLRPRWSRGRWAFTAQKRRGGACWLAWRACLPSRRATTSRH
jgi:hypothetical protein